MEISPHNEVTWPIWFQPYAILARTGAERMMAERSAAIRALGDGFHAGFLARGATAFETSILQPAGTLLDLYGEDIRARAYTTADPLRGEQMLRPDFTVPVVQAHIAAASGPMRYAYRGEVFRRQEQDAERPTEYLQVGYERIGDDDMPEQPRQRCFWPGRTAHPLHLQAEMGDIGLLMAVVDGLPTTPRRRAALRRHARRPTRFGPCSSGLQERPAPASRGALLTVAEHLDGAGRPGSGLRRPAEVRARVAALQEDAEAPLEPGLLTLLDEPVRAAPAEALAQLQLVSRELPAIAIAVDRLAARLSAFDSVGLDLSKMIFEGAYGRTLMEYYDGLVFGFSVPGRDDLPMVATGGRYDALTARLGRAVPAVGGVIRPSVLHGRCLKLGLPSRGGSWKKPSNGLQSVAHRVRS